MTESFKKIIFYKRVTTTIYRFLVEADDSHAGRPSVHHGAEAPVQLGWFAGPQS